MIEDKQKKYRNKPGRIHIKSLFQCQVPHNRFVELEKKVLLPLTIFIRKILLEIYTNISFMDSTPLHVCRNQSNSNS